MQVQENKTKNSGKFDSGNGVKVWSDGSLVKNFGKIQSEEWLPDLIEVQIKSFDWFLQDKVSKRADQGLQAVFKEIFPIESPHEDVVLEFIEYEIGDPKYSENECKDRDVSYAAPLKATIRLITKETMEVREQQVYMGDIPLMTRRGTFIINGAERVVVNQLHRSPGIFFFFDKEERLYNSRIIPDKGSWLEFEMDAKGHIVARIDRKSKFPVTLLVRAMGYEKNEELARLFYEVKDYDLKSEEDYKALNGRRFASDVISSETGEIICEVGDRINTDTIDQLREASVKKVSLIEFPNSKDDAFFANTIAYEKEFERKKLLISDEDFSRLSPSDLALLAIHSVVRPGEPTTLDNARNEWSRMFFSPKSYALGAVGRYKINNKFGFNTEVQTLTNDDIISSIKYMLYLIAEADSYPVEITDPVTGEKKKSKVLTIVDDIDHLGNRRVRSVGELIMNQIKTGFQRMERVIKERMQQASPDLSGITPQSLISIKPITAVLNEFFGSSQLSQFMDQTNPLAELTHKRRLNALGPGGLSRDRAGADVRDVHPSHYGRMCPIETPEGPNIGLIVSLSAYSKINKYGFMETPYKVVEKGKVTDKVDYLTADIEDKYFIAQANAETNEDGSFKGNLIPCRNRGNFPYKRPKEIQYMDVSPNQVFSVSTGLIPFLEHDDANRALMGSNMQRQAVPLMVEEAPLVGTGMEPHAAYDSGVLIKADRGGEVIYADAAKVVVRANNGEEDEYDLQKYKRSNQGTCFNQKPVVTEGKKIKAGDVIADGPATEHGRLALGKNIIVAFMPWMGYNFEDAILLSEKLVANDVFTSIHIENFQIEARETKLGTESITRDIPNIGEKAFRDLDEEGIVRIGAYVEPGDILVGKVTPKGEQELTPEYKLLHSIFGEKARDVRDTSLKVPNGVEGIVIDVKKFTRANGDELAPGVEELVKVYIADKRKIQVGDKMSGRHGNKGVISRVLPEYDMPYLPDGTPVDIVLNPLGIPSRMNIGQLLETELGWAAKELGLQNNTRIFMETPIFDGAQEDDIRGLLKDAGLPEDSKTVLYDGRTGEPFEDKVMVGCVYMLKLAHMVDDKMHARSTGPYSLVTQQPLGGKAQFGGQRLGEMEVWALEAYGAAYTLQELLTVKSDDMAGRSRIYEAIVKGINSTSPGIPESFNVLIQELRGLALDVRVFDKNEKEISLAEWSDDFSKPTKEKMKLDTLLND